MKVFDFEIILTAAGAEWTGTCAARKRLLQSAWYLAHLARKSACTKPCRLSGYRRALLRWPAGHCAFAAWRCDVGRRRRRVLRRTAFPPHCPRQAASDSARTLSCCEPRGWGAGHWHAARADEWWLHTSNWCLRCAPPLWHRAGCFPATLPETSKHMLW